MQKKSNNLVNIHQPLRLFPIISKIFERLIPYSFFIQNIFFTQCQSGFMPGDYNNLVLPFVLGKSFKFTKILFKPLSDI